jgi:hypothetical protein
MEITGVTGFIEKCFKYHNRAPAKVDKDRVLFFRGQNCKYGAIVPSIYHSEYNIRNEERIFKESIAEFPDELGSLKTTIEKLIVMQHYELPTRILDISKNPLVSLFFASYLEERTPETKETDGVVYVFSIPRDDIKYCGSDVVCVIANLCKRPCSFTIRDSLKSDREDFNKVEEIQNLVHDIRDDKPFFQNLVLPETIGEVACLFPSMNNTRIIRQDGYFLLFGIDGEKKNCAKINPKWIADEIRIPASSKAQILRELDMLNINEAFLYADYKHLGNHLQKRYT